MIMFQALCSGNRKMNKTSVVHPQVTYAQTTLLSNITFYLLLFWCHLRATY